VSGWFKAASPGIFVTCGGAPFTLAQTNFSTLHADVAACTMSTFFSVSCMAAADHLCGPSATSGGFGVVEFNPATGDATIVCGSASVPLFVRESGVVFANLTGAAATSIAAHAKPSIDAFCISKAHSGGVGPVEVSGGVIDVLCTP